MNYEIIYRLCDYGSPGDRKELLRLYRKVFHLNEIGRWFEENPYGKPLGVAAVEAETGRFVGHFGTAAIRICVGGREMDGRMSMGFMVDEDYRRCGIADRLSNELFREIVERDSDVCVIGFPNEVSYKLHIRRMRYESIRDYHFVTLPPGRGRAEYRFDQVRTADHEIPSPAGYRTEQNIAYGNGFSAPDGQKAVASNKPADSVLESEAPYPGLTNPDIKLTDSCLELTDRSGRNSMCHTADFLRWRYGDGQYRIYESSEGHFFIFTIFRDKADILLWDAGAEEDELLAFGDFIRENFNVRRVCSWNTFPYMEKYEGEQRHYHFCMRILTQDADLRTALKKEWTFFMGDCELF